MKTPPRPPCVGLLSLRAGTGLISEATAEKTKSPLLIAFFIVWQHLKDQSAFLALKCSESMETLNTLITNGKTDATESSRIDSVFSAVHKETTKPKKCLQNIVVIGFIKVQASE